MAKRQAGGPRPVPLTVVTSAIPAELKAVPSWVAWRYERRDGAWAKVPVNCLTGRNADATDPCKLVGFEQAVACYEAGRLAGVGFVFGDDELYAGVDLDDCCDFDTGALAPHARQIVQELRSYTEISPSGTGIKIILRGKVPPGGNRARGIEMYSRRRFFTVTGRHWPDAPNTVEDRQAELGALHARVFAQRCGKRWACSQGGLTDEEVIARAARGEPFRRLWQGDVSNYNSPSEADLALCGMLACSLGPDANPQRIERLFGLSEVAKRGKWASRPDYREMTITKALGGPNTASAGDSMLTRTNQPTRTNQAMQDESGIIISTFAFQAKNASLSPSEEQQAIEMAESLAESDGKLPDWEVMFKLARRLRSLVGEGGDSQQFHKAVVVFCEKAGAPVEDYWYTFLTCWEKVRLSVGEDVLAWAMNQAKAKPIMPITQLTGKYVLIASLAWNLSQLRRGKAFWLPVSQLAELLNTTAMTVSRIIDLLETNKVIRCVDENYSFRKKKAKEYEFTFPATQEPAQKIV